MYKKCINLVLTLLMVALMIGYFLFPGVVKMNHIIYLLIIILIVSYIFRMQEIKTFDVVNGYVYDYQITGNRDRWANYIYVSYEYNGRTFKKQRRVPSIMFFNGKAMLNKKVVVRVNPNDSQDVYVELPKEAKTMTYIIWAPILFFALYSLLQFYFIIKRIK